MICEEPGVLPGSEFFFYTPTEGIEKHFYYILVSGRFSCNNQYKIRRRAHLGPLILFVDDGELYVEYEEKTEVVCKNELLLLNCDRPHAYYVKNDCKFHFLHIGGKDCREITDSLVAANQSIVFRLSDYRKVRDIIEPLVSRMYHVEQIPEREMSIAVYQILCTIQTTGSLTPVYNPPNKDMIDDVINFIRANPDQIFHINQLAERANMSPYYFSHQFKAVTGQSPISYMFTVKINLAKNMLLYTDNSISKISEQLGFSSSSSFINAFKSRVGVSPLSFRKHPELYNL